MGRFTGVDKIFDNEEVLTDGYIPDTLVAREDEMHKYAEVLRTVANGSIPRNVFVYGDTGVGKTLATEMILNELLEDQSEFPNVSIDVIWQNCKDATSYQVGCDLVNSFRDPSDHITKTGHSRSSVNQKLWRHVDASDNTHILFVLDEINSLKTDDELLYEIPRARANGNITETKIGLIGISNDFKFRDDLSAQVQSTLCEHEIHFRPYDANELQRILTERANNAFKDGVLSQEVIPLTSAQVAQRTGSAREAISILSKAGLIARSNDDLHITEAHIDEAHGEIKRGLVRDELEALPTQSHLVLYAVLSLHRQGRTPVRRKIIRERYEEIVNLLQRDTVSDRTLSQRLNQLSLKAFLECIEKNQGLSGGVFYKYDFNASEEIVADVLKSESSVKEIIGRYV